MDEVVHNLRACLLSSKGGLNINKINKDYYDINGERIPYRKFDFNSLEEFLEVVPGIKKVYRGNDCFFEAIPNAKSVHLANLVRGQKNARKKSNRTTSYNRPPRPLFCPRPSYQRNQTRPQTRNISLPVNARFPSQNNSAFVQTNSRVLSTSTAKSNGTIKKVTASVNSRYSPTKNTDNIPSTSAKMTNSSSNVNERPNYTSMKNEGSRTGTASNPSTSVNMTNSSAKVNERPSYTRIINEGPRTSPTKKMIDRNVRSAAPLSMNGSAKPKSVQCRLIMPNTSETTTSQFNLNRSKVEEPKPVLKTLNMSNVTNNSNYPREAHNVTPVPVHSTVRTDQFFKKEKQTEEEKLLSLTAYLKLPPPVYKILSRTNGCVYAQVTIGNEKYSSYPEDAKNERAAQLIVINKALTDLKEKHIPVELPITKDEHLIKTRMLKIVDAHPCGVFTDQFIKYYQQEFKEGLPVYWKKIVNECPEISIESGPNKITILTRYTPPSKVQETPLQSPLAKLRLNPLGHTVPGKLEKPKESYWIIYVTVVIDTSEIWGRLVGEDYSEQFDVMATEIKEFYNKNVESTKATRFEPGAYYSILLNDSWHRVKCLEYDAETEKASIFFIDHGDDEICDTKLLHNLVPQFCKLPGQALRLSLHGLEVFADSEIATEIVEDNLLDQTLYVDEQNYDSEEDCTSVIFYDTQGPDDINLSELISKNIIENIMTKPQLEKGRADQAYVSFVNKSGDVYLHLKNDNMKILIDLMNEIIINKLSGDLTPLAVSKINHEKLYMVKSHEDGSWYRASVSDVNYTLNEVVAFLLDFGKTIKTKISSLVELEGISEMIAQIPGQALKVHLNNVPLSSFDEEKVVRLRELAPPEICLLVRLSGKDMDTSTPVVELLKRQEPSNEIVSINNTLVFDKELPSPTNGDDNNNIKGKKRSERLTSRYGSSADRNNPYQVRALQPPTIPAIGEYFDVHVTLAANPGRFVVQPHKTQIDLINMMHNLQEECKNYNGAPPSFDSVMKGNLYAAQHSDTHWYRVCVLNTFVEQMVTVYFCDYGDIVIISQKQLQPLPSQFSELPYQAIVAKLADVNPINVDWSVQDCLRFQDLVVEKDLVSIVKETVLCPISGDTQLTLTLYDVSGKEDVNIGLVLLDEGRAQLREP